MTSNPEMIAATNSDVPIQSVDDASPSQPALPQPQLQQTMHVTTVVAGDEEEEAAPLPIVTFDWSNYYFYASYF